ncbi:MAG: HD family phosphohydrolase, partial [Pseudobdellovibrionaceae bacterium]
MSKNKNSKSSKKSDAPSTRVNYEDHSLKFLNWTDSLGIEKSRMVRILRYLQDHTSAQYMIMVFVFCILLSYLTFYRFESSYSFKVGDIATYDVNSPMEFEMVDEVTTEEKRQKAEQSITVIYDFDPAVFERVSTGVIHSYRNMRSYLRDVVWPQSSMGRLEKMKELFQYKPQFEKDLGSTVSDFTFEWLIEQKFNPRIESILIRNLGIWYEKKIAEAPDRFIPEAQKQVLARVVHKNNLGKEFLMNKVDILDLQTPEHFVFEDRRGLVALNESDRANLLYFARSILVPNLTLNKQETATRRQGARESVLPVNIVVKKNQNIALKGSLVQPSQLAVMKKIEEIRSDRSNHLVVLAMACLLFVVVLVFFTYVRRFTVNKVNIDFKDLAVMMMITLGLVVMCKVFYFIADNAFMVRLSHILPATVFLFAAPLAAAPMLVGLLITSGEVVWLFTAFISISLGIMVDFNFQVLLVSLLGGIAAARGVHGCKTRNQIYWAGVRT